MLHYNKILSKYKFTSDCAKTRKFFEDQTHRVMDSSCFSIGGRFESVKLSPSANFIAYASFDLNKIFIFHFTIKKYIISLSYYFCFEEDLFYPHDFEWLDDKTIIVANREAKPSILKFETDNIKISNKLELCLTNSTNSVSILNSNDNKTEILFATIKNELTYCCLDKRLNILDESILLKNLKCPDGIAINPQKNQIAITNALDNSIAILNPKNTDDLFLIKNIQRPHSVCFLSNNYLACSSASDKFIFIFDTKSSQLITRIKAMSEQQFSTKYSDAEGGVKGLSHNFDLELLLGTCPNVPFLAFDTSIFRSFF